MMSWHTRLHNAAHALLAAIGLAVVTGGCSRTAAPQATPPSDTARKVEAKKPDYSPYPDQQFPNRVYWGVAHVHTGYSFDSGMFGVTMTPDDLFRVATGGEVVMDNGQRFKQDRPLDWVSITDHAEYMGISDQIRAGSPELLANPQGKRWYEMSKTSPQEGVKAAIEAVVSMQSGKPVFDASKLTAAAWAHATAAAEKWNQPGVFTDAARLRVDLRARRQQPASHRRLPRRRGPREPGRSLLHLRQPGSGGPLEVHGRVREEDRRPGARHPAQRQPEQRHDVLGGDLRRKAHGPGLRRDARQPRAAPRGDADQG